MIKEITLNNKIFYISIEENLNSTSNSMLMVLDGLEIHTVDSSKLGFHGSLRTLNNINFKYYVNFSWYSISKFNEEIENCYPECFYEETISILNYLRKTFEIDDYALLTQSWGSLPALDILEKFEWKPLFLILTGPILTKFNEHIKYRLREGNVFGNLLNKEPDGKKEEFVKSYENYNIMNYRFKKFSKRINIILGKSESEKVTDIATNFAKWNEIENIFFIENAGHLPWLPIDYGKRAKDFDQNIWNAIKEQTGNDFGQKVKLICDKYI